MKQNLTKRLLALLLTLAMLIPMVGLGGISAAAADPEPETTVIQILATSDIHGAFSDKSYSTGLNNTGLARVATEIRRLRAANGNTLLIDLGDSIQGNGTTVFLSDATVDTELPEKTKLVIIHTNDSHGRDLHNYQTNPANGSVGTAGVAQLKKDFEAAGAEVLLLNAGDVMQGVPLVNQSQGAAGMYFANLAGYDVLVPGNHEFDWGVLNLLKVVEENEFLNDGPVSFPVLSANTFWDIDEYGLGVTPGDLVFDDNTIIEIAGMKVGIFGLTTPESATKAHPDKIKGLRFAAGEALYEIAQEQVDYLTEAGADIIVCVGHLGTDTSSSPNRSIDVINEVDGIDLFIDGHSHTKPEFNQTIGSTLLVSSFEHLKNVGVIVYDEAAGTFTSTTLDCTTYRGYDPAINKIINDMGAGINAELKAQVLGKTEVLLYGKNTIAPIAGARVAETTMGNYAADAIMWQADQYFEDLTIDCAITNGGGVRDSIPQSGTPTAADPYTITMLDMVTVFPFGNIVTVLETTGAELLEALEASCQGVVMPTSSAVGGFPQVSGITFDILAYVPYVAGPNYPGTTIASPAEPGDRVTNVMIGGEPLNLEATYTIATNDFVAAGGDTYYVFKAAIDTFQYAIPMEDAMKNYFDATLSPDGIKADSVYAGLDNRIIIKTAADAGGAVEPLAVIGNAPVATKDVTVGAAKPLTAAEILESGGSGGGITVPTTSSGVKWSDYEALYPTLRGLELLDYDAWVLGNHEFNFGMDALERAWGKGEEWALDIPILAGNLVPAGVTDENYTLDSIADSDYLPYFYKDFVIDGITVKLAIVGMTHQNIINWDRANLDAAGLTTVSPVVATKKAIEKIKADQPDAIIVLAEHMDEASGAVAVLQDNYIASNVALFIGAHGHLNVDDTREKTNIINGVKYVERQDAGKQLSTINLTLTKEGGKWLLKDKIANVKAANIALTNASPVDQLYAGDSVIKAANVLGLANCNTEIGELIGEPLVRDSELKGAYDGFLYDNALTDFINDAMLYYTNEYVNVMNSEVTSGSITISGTAPLDELANAQPGVITKGGVASIYKYDNNTLYAVRMTGAHLKAWMEWSYNYYHTLSAGDLTIGYGGTGHDRGYNCDQFSGITYTVDLTQPVGKRVTITGYTPYNHETGTYDAQEGTFNLAAFLAGSYNVAVNNYRASSQLTAYSEVKSNGVVTNYTNSIFGNLFDLSKETLGDPKTKLPVILAQDIETNVTGEGMLGMLIDYIDDVMGGTVDNTDDRLITSNWSFKLPAANEWETELRDDAIVAINAQTDIAVAADTSSKSPIEKIRAANLLIDDSYRYSVLRPLSVFQAASVMELDRVDFFSFNDFHGAVDKSASSSNPGSDHFVAVAQELTKQNTENGLLLAGGDNYQGSPLSNIFFGEPVSDMLEYMGIEYSALGNHEFDWVIKDEAALTPELEALGLEVGDLYIKKFAADGDLTFLAANIIETATGEVPDYCEPYAIVETDDYTVGIIGLTTLEIPSLVKASNVEGLEFLDPVPIVKELSAELKAQGCDFVIALTHLGAAQDATTGVITGDAADLAEACQDDLDLVISAHTHRWVAGMVGTVPVIQGGYNGRGMARAMFVMDDGEIVETYLRSYTQNQMNGTEGSLLYRDTVNTDVKGIIAQYNTDVEPEFAVVVGQYGMVIDSREAQNVWATQLVHNYITAETDTNYILFQNSGGWRDTAPYNKTATSDVTMGYLYTLMPFDNEIVLMDMKGSDLLADLLSDSAVVTGTKCVAGAYRSGDKWYEIGADGKDHEIDPNKTYKVACNDFMLTGGDYYNFTHGINQTFMGVPLRDAMVEQLQGDGFIAEVRGTPVNISGGGTPITPKPPVVPDPVDPDPVITVEDMTDVATGAWYYEDVAAVIEKGLMIGISSTKFAPEVTLTRDMFVTILYRLAGEPDVEGGEHFADVVADSWYDKAVSWAVENNITEGTGSGFGVGVEVTRESMVLFLYRYLKENDMLGDVEPADLSSFPDAGKVASWSSEAVAWAVGAGLLNGTDKGELNPTGNAMRAEAATLFIRVINYIDGLDA